MSDGIHGHGTALTVNDGVNTTTIGNIVTITGPDEARDPIDISTMESTSKSREFIPGMLDGGEASFEINYDGTAAGSADALNTLKTASAQTWTITFNDALDASHTDSSWASAGFITGLGFAAPFDDKATQTVTLKFTGVPTYSDVA